MSDHPNPYIEYLKTLLETETTPTRISELSDCLILNQLLSKISQFKQPSIEHSPKTFAHIFSNLKETYKQIQVFWVECLGRTLECGEIDLVEIAHYSNEKEIQKILDLFIQTTIQSSAKEYFVGKMLETSPETQQYFMNIVEKTLQECSSMSPRKKREQRLYDKLVELDHENENLQIAIKQICQQKYELQVKYQHLIDGIKEKNIEIERLSGFTTDFYQTPQRKKNFPNQSVQKNSEYIQRLKAKITQMTKDHEKQIYHYEQQIEIFTNKMQKLIDLQNRVELYEAKIEAGDQLMTNYDDLASKYHKLNEKVSEKDELIDIYIGKLNEKDEQIRKLEEQALNKDTQLQKMTVKIEQYRELTNKFHNDENIGYLSPVSLRKTLSQHCPDVYNTQTEVLLETNRKLRAELERSSNTIKEREAELAKLKKQYDLRENLEFQNRKLLSVIEQNNEKHQDQKYLLLGCVYELRNRYLNEAKPKQNRKQDIKKLIENPYHSVRGVKKGLRILNNFNYQ